MATIRIMAQGGGRGKEGQRKGGEHTHGGDRGS